MELLLAVFIFGFIALTVYGVLSRAIHARIVGEERAELYAIARETLLKMVDDLEGALLPLSGDRIYFRGEAQAVQFVAMNRGGYGQGRVRPGQVLIEYSMSDIDKRGFGTLVRGETDFKFLLDQADGVTYNDDDSRFDLDDSNDVEAPTELYLPLLECPPGAEQSGIPGSCIRLAALRFRFYDDAFGDWRDYWDSFEEQGATENRLPDAVEIAMLLLDENGGEHDFYTVVDLPLARANPTPGEEEFGDDDDDDGLDDGD
jgi:hypothetical protein